MEDMFASLVMWPMVCSQLSLQAKFAGEPVVDINADPNEGLDNYQYAHSAAKIPNGQQVVQMVPPPYPAMHPLQSAGPHGNHGAF